jgi:glycosyltransferase involved in cell wall biosynthesis
MSGREPGARRAPTATPPSRLVILTGLDVRAFRGGEKYAATLARELAHRGVEVLLFSKVDPNERYRLEPAAFRSELGVPVRFYRLLWLPIFPPFLRAPFDFLRTLRHADTVFTLESTPRFVALVVFVARLLGRRSVVGFHHPSQADDFASELRKRGLAGMRARFFRWILRRADALHTINESQAAALRSAGFTNVEMVHSFTTALPRAPRPERVGSFRALFVGPLEREQKGIDLLVDVARRVLVDRDDVELRIAGAGRDEGLVRALAAEFPRRVELLGFVPEETLPEVYADADALWLTSRAESFSLVALEALTQGVPVVSFAIPGLADVTSIFPEGRVPPFDPAAFAQEAVRLADLHRQHPEGFAQIRQRLRREAVAQLGASVMVPRLARMLSLSLPEELAGASNLGALAPS